MVETKNNIPTFLSYLLDTHHYFILVAIVFLLYMLFDRSMGNSEIHWKKSKVFDSDVVTTFCWHLAVWICQNFTMGPDKYLFDCFIVKKKRLKKIAWIRSHHLNLQWKLKLWAGKFTWGNKAKHCYVMSTNFWKQKVCWQRPAMWLYTSSKFSGP